MHSIFEGCPAQTLIPGVIGLRQTQIQPDSILASFVDIQSAINTHAQVGGKVMGGKLPPTRA
jgi:hypothetical protein